MPTYQFMPISADTSTRRWIAAGLGDRPQVRRALFLQSAVRVQEDFRFAVIREQS
jgi:hypothetical protein